jgi:hypothetical protein
MLEKNLSIENEITLKVNGRNVKFIEFEPTLEGDFLKICTHEHDLGVDAEYVWFKNKYKNAFRIKQTYTSIILNGNEAACDILEIKTEDDKIKEVYFDISQMMENLHNTIASKTNMDLWEDRARVIYDKLKSDFDFSIYNNDEESLHKEINEIISIGFDITYFFGFIITKNNNLNKMLRERDKCLRVLAKYIANGFIEKITIKEKIIGGYIKMDDINDLNIVFENYRKLEEEYMEIK